MHKNLIFSVGVITYNQEKYISQTLDSILNQEHDYPYEIIIGDDCSKDRTPQILDEYAARYPDIVKPIHNPENLGIIGNYFNVINHCAGKYIMECAGDDYWLPGKVAAQIQYMEKNPDVGLLYGIARRWNEKKQEFMKHDFGVKKSTLAEFLYGNVVPAPTICFRKDLLERYVKEIEPQKRNWLMEDFPEMLWFSAESKIEFMETSWAVYRELNDSASHFVNVKKLHAFYKSSYEIADFFARKYGLEYYVKPDEEIDFDIYWNSLCSSWGLTGRKEFWESYKNLKAPAKKHKIKYLCTKSILLLYMVRLVMVVKHSSDN